MTDKKPDWDSNQTDWTYWSNLPSISAEDACWLFCGVDPNVCNTDSIENKHELSNEKKTEIQKVSTQMNSDIQVGTEEEHNSPWNWVCWAKSKGINVPEQFYKLAYEANIQKIRCHSVTQPLEEISPESMEWYMKQDSWTSSEAIFLMHGLKPTGQMHGSDEVRTHFPEVYHMLRRSITTGSVGKEITQAGQRDFIDTPQEWLEWGRGKGCCFVEVSSIPFHDRTDQMATQQSLNEDMPIPGKPPRIAIRRLTIQAAWQIEQETKKRATAKEVMKQLQAWADKGEYSETLVSSDIRNKSVKWITDKGVGKKYSLEACGKALSDWYKSRNVEGD